MEEMTQTLIQELVEFVKTASPIIWQAAYRQAYMQAIESFLVFLGLVSLALYGAKWYRHFTGISDSLSDKIKNSTGYNGTYEHDKEGVDIIRVALVALIIIVIGISILALSAVVSRVLNPDYYAIKILAEMVGL